MSCIMALQVRYTFWYIALPLSAKQREMIKFKFYVECERTTVNFLALSKLETLFLRIQLLGQSSYTLYKLNELRWGTVKVTALSFKASPLQSQDAKFPFFFPLCCIRYALAYTITL